MKLVGMITVAATIIVFGFIKSEQISKTKKILSAFRMFVKDVSCKIEFSSSSVIELLKENKYKELFFFKEITTDMLKNREKLHEFIVNKCEDKEIAQLLADFIEGLGTSDKRGQLKHCGLYQSLLEQNSVRIKEECDRKSSLYRSLSCLSAAAFLIVMI